MAQAPTFSPPSLPAIPGLPPLPGAPVAAIPGAPSTPSTARQDTGLVSNPSNPGLADLKQLPDPTAAAPGDALADLPPPAIPEAGDITTVTTLPAISVTPPPATPEAGDVTIVPMLPPAVVEAEPGAEAAVTAELGAGEAPPLGLALPPPPVAGGAKASPSAPPPIGTITRSFKPGGLSLPEPLADSSPKAKTWQTALKPSSTAYDTKFNYRRAVLPGSIYRTSYPGDNRHLPTRVTRDDYVQLLFASAATNNIDATRALLNAGTDINATNARGETPLSIARRYGAVDTAALLTARGAR